MSLWCYQDKEMEILNPPQNSILSFGFESSTIISYYVTNDKIVITDYLHKQFLGIEEINKFLLLNDIQIIFVNPTIVKEVKKDFKRDVKAIHDFDYHNNLQVVIARLNLGKINFLKPNNLELDLGKINSLGYCLSSLLEVTRQVSWSKVCYSENNYIPKLEKKF
jgi:hypothetical protein